MEDIRYPKQFIDYGPIKWRRSGRLWERPLDG